MKELLLLVIVCILFNQSFAITGCYDSANVLPIPARAFGNIAVGAEYYLEKLTNESSEEGIYFVTNGVYNTMFIVSKSDGVAMFDAPGSWARSAIQNVTTLPVKVMVYSHSHADHIGDAGNFPNGIDIIAHEATSEYLLSRLRDGNNAIPIPDITWCDSFSFEHGDYQIEMSIKNQQSTHVHGNALIWVPKAKILLHVDVIYPRWAPFNRNGEAENITALPANIDAVLAFPFEIFVGGHVGRWGTRDDVQEIKDFVLDMIEVADRTGNLPPDEFFPLLQTGNWWNFVRAWYLTMACNCATELTNRWGTTLGGVDVFSENNCVQIQESRRLGADLQTLVYPPRFPSDCKDDNSNSNSNSNTNSNTNSNNNSNSDDSSNSSFLLVGLIPLLLVWLLL